MTIKRCDNCRRIIKELDREAMHIYYGFNGDFEFCGKCKNKIIQLMLGDEYFSQSLKDRISQEDPLLVNLNKMKKLTSKLK